MLSPIVSVLELFLAAHTVLGLLGFLTGILAGRDYALSRSLFQTFYLCMFLGPLAFFIFLQSDKNTGYRDTICDTIKAGLDKVRYWPLQEKVELYV